MNRQITSNNSRRKWWQLGLSSLLLVVTIAAVLTAWFVDHHNLRSQIKPLERKFVAVCQLQNASPARVMSELSILYPGQRFVSGATGNPSGMTKSQQDQSVIVSCDESVRDQIGIIIQHFDRKNTDMTDLDLVTEEGASVNRN